MTDVLCIIGTRPELPKTLPVVSALQDAGLDAALLSTGQHATLIDLTAGGAIPNMPTLGIASDGTLLRFVAKARAALRAKLLEEGKPRAILVQGDTMSAFVGAEVATEFGVPLAHVEAGVRSGDRSEPWPEELIRVEIDRIATWRYAPTERAMRHLAKEAEPHILDGDHNLVVGNTSIDALRLFTTATPRPEASDRILMTLHRRELRDAPDALDMLGALMESIARLHVGVTWLVHPGMNETVGKLRLPSNLYVRPPLSHRECATLLAESRGLFTDSGGLVEEAASLGVPTVIWRGANDRPEAVEAGIAIQIAPTDPTGALRAMDVLASCAIPRKPSNVYGDGHAAERIATHLAAALTARG